MRILDGIRFGTTKPPIPNLKSYFKVILVPGSANPNFRINPRQDSSSRWFSLLSYLNMTFPRRTIMGISNKKSGSLQNKYPYRVITPLRVYYYRAYVKAIKTKKNFPEVNELSAQVVCAARRIHIRRDGRHDHDHDPRPPTHPLGLESTRMDGTKKEKSVPVDSENASGSGDETMEDNDDEDVIIYDTGETNEDSQVQTPTGEEQAASDDCMWAKHTASVGQKLRA
ncbi:hypothetical protein AVEN_190890-1 [Araneus ventricosus]|uniref:Uncharacterized protein n=1 Tax=Araneus ventricosus TaxID=182803 RepID=A0A4Y2CTT0_ARAVE|nr:hypothetical protein AVEN_190890-1 [Araneus ventricosus]